MRKLLVVFGATGNQGGSVITHVLSDPVLSSEYTIRAVTRDPSSSKARLLRQKGVRLFPADLNDPSSIPAAVGDAHTVFLISATSLANARETERVSASRAAVACVEAGVQHLIYSTLPSIDKISAGKYTQAASYDGKAEAAEHIRSLPIRSSFVAAGSFMQNWHGILKPKAVGDGTYVVKRPVSPDTQLPLLDVGDLGAWVCAMLADPERFLGKTVCAAAALYSMADVVRVLTAKTGKQVRYEQISVELFRKGFGGNPFTEHIIDKMLFQQDFGYYGPGTAEQVAEGAACARGHVSTFEEYLDRNPLIL